MDGLELMTRYIAPGSGHAAWVRPAINEQISLDASSRSNDAARQQQEMDAEARAYKKITEERKRSALTTEHCYMKNGNLECKPAP